MFYGIFQHRNYSQSQAHIIIAKPQSLNELDKYIRAGCDIFVYIGHSHSEEDATEGYISLENKTNEGEQIAISRLEERLNQARKNINHPLQLSIFTSCRGFGLANIVNSVDIPYVIAMRNSLPEEVGQKFMKEFFNNFITQEQPLHIALRNTRNIIKYDYSEKYPGIEWLPQLFCHPQAVNNILTWKQFLPPEKQFFSLETILSKEFLLKATGTGIMGAGVLFWGYSSWYSLRYTLDISGKFFQNYTEVDLPKETLSSDISEEDQQKFKDEYVSFKAIFSHILDSEYNNEPNGMKLFSDTIQDYLQLGLNQNKNLSESDYILMVVVPLTFSLFNDTSPNYIVIDKTKLDKDQVNKFLNGYYYQAGDILQIKAFSNHQVRDAFFRDLTGFGQMTINHNRIMSGKPMLNPDDIVGRKTVFILEGHKIRKIGEKKTDGD